MTEIKVLDNVERIPTPPAEVLLRDYVLKCRPVVLTDMFDDRPVRALDTSEKLRELLPALPIAIQPNYIKALLAQGTTANVERTTLARFLDHVAADPATDHYCVEYATPPELAALIEPTAHCRLIDEQDLRSLMFVAAPGNFAHLHYDDDQRHTLMYQVFGRKRYSIIAAREGGKVAPLADPGIQRTSSVFLQHFSTDDKLAFLRYTNAWDCVLHPGETLLMPMMAWHYIEYLDTSLSVSYRLGRNRYNRFLAESVPTPSVFLQRVAVEFVDEARVDAKRCAAFTRLQAEARRSYPSPTARAQALDRCCMAICDELEPAAATRFYTIFDKQRRDLTKADTPSKPGTAHPPHWRDPDRVTLGSGAFVVQPLSDAGDTRSVLLGREGRLEFELTLDQRRPWLLDLLHLLSAPGAKPTVAELIRRCEADPTALRAALTQLYERGWAVPVTRSDRLPRRNAGR